MKKKDHSLAEAALDRLLNVGTVRGVCLGRGGEVLVNDFPFSDERLLNLCADAEQVLQDFAEHGRSVERMVFGFDGGHLVLLVDGDVRLLIMHLIPDEADFVAKAGQAFLADHRESIAAMDAMLIEREIAAETEGESNGAEDDLEEDDVVADHREGGGAEAEADRPTETESEECSEAAAAKNVQPPEREDLQLVVSKPEAVELPLESAPSEESGLGGQNAGFRELLEASRSQDINDAVLATDSEEEVCHDVSDTLEDDSSLAAWAAEHLDLPEDASHLLPPKHFEKRSHHSTVGRSVVGAVKVQPVRLAAQQPQSTLPAQKKPSVRRAKATAEDS